MRDYNFGDFLCELRVRRGLTQYQLGALVGVSDKAVSKWESGTSKPQSGILFQISEILGISIDELMACRYRSSEEKNMKGIFLMKKQLFNKAFDTMRERYGQSVSVEIMNRFLSESSEMQNTDMIIYLNFLATLASLAEKQGELIRVRGGTGASFIAYLLGATEINPLRPHYYCPTCKTVEFDDSVCDGWDLPTRKCTCGKEMIGDGHHIPFETYHHVVCKNTGFDLSMSPRFFESAKKIIKEYFYECKLISLVKKEQSGTITFVLVPESVKLPTDIPLSFEDHYEQLMKYPSFTFFADEEFDRYKQLQEVTSIPFIRVPFWQSEVLQEFKDGNTNGIPEFRLDFFKDMLYEVKPDSFCDLIQICGLSHGTGVWADNAKDLIGQGIPVCEVIAYRDDVFTKIQDNLMQKGQTNMGFAYKIMEDTRRGVYARGGVSDEMKQQFKYLGVEDWVVESIGKIKYLFPKAHGVLYVKLAATLMWYKIHYSKDFTEIFQ